MVRFAKRRLMIPIGQQGPLSGRRGQIERNLKNYGSRHVMGCVGFLNLIMDSGNTAPFTARILLSELCGIA